MHLPVFLFILFFCPPQVDLDVKGKYRLENQISKSQQLVMELRISRSAYELTSSSNFKGDFIEKGTWTLAGDTLTLQAQTRKDVYNKKGSYNTNFRKQEYEYDKKVRYRIYQDQICDLKAASTGKGYCFMRE